MAGFNVLDPKFSILESRFIEASAGTGKTFTIENIVLRLLLEEKGPSIDQILVVTFTKKATRELKTRILARIEKALLEQIEPEAKKRLKNALLLFDEAKIFTIHGFCLFALKEFAFDSPFFLDEQENTASFSACIPILKDFLRTELTQDLIHPKQMEKVLKMHQNDIELLAKKLIKISNERIPVVVSRPFSEIENIWIQGVNDLKNSLSIEPEKLESDLLQLAPFFGKLCDRQKNVKPEVVEGIQRFVSFFCESRLELSDSPILKMAAENRLKKELPCEKLFYPELLEKLQKKIIPLLEEATDPLLILGNLAEKCRLFLERVVEKKDLIFFEDLLRQMEKKIEVPSFAGDVRKNFQAVLIDEFQDTDPTQWQIFSKLFICPEFTGPIFLVGDPKQSIYNFRGADVYTYFKAKKQLGEDKHATLSQNYRSDPPLVNALNTLFSKEFLHLPKTKEIIACLPVEPAATILPPFGDGKGSVHFCEADTEEDLFLFVKNEILRLHENEKVPLNGFAILVKDRYQAERFSANCPFPLAIKEHQLLGETPAFYLLHSFFQAVLNPHNRSFVAKAAMSALFDFQEENLDEQIAIFYEYKHHLETEGVFSLFKKMVQNSVIRDEKLYRHMQQIVEWIAKKTHTKEEILPFLQVLKEEDNEEFQVHTPEEKDAVQVLTIHLSKGLEFYVVFPIGLAISSHKKRDFVQEDGKIVLKESSEEADAEKMRQLYVAFTRAKKRLYIPILKKDENSPISLFLRGNGGGILCQNASFMTHSLCQEYEKKEYLNHICPLIPPKSYVSKTDPSFLYSFSSLAKHTVKISVSSERAEKTLPVGAETGNLLHRLLEVVEFDKASDPRYLHLVAQSVLKNTALEGWMDEVVKMVTKVLDLPFSCEGDSFYLKDLEAPKMIRELEFLYPSKEPNGFCKGFIDLFFEYKGGYYFLDWKSNDLGGSYSKEKMKDAMEENQYTLQASLYSKAIKKYLKLFEKDHLFRGCFYVFLRGPSFLFYPDNHL